MGDAREEDRDDGTEYLIKREKGQPWLRVLHSEGLKVFFRGIKFNFSCKKHGFLFPFSGLRSRADGGRQRHCGHLQGGDTQSGERNWICFSKIVLCQLFIYIKDDIRELGMTLNVQFRLTLQWRDPRIVFYNLKVFVS